EQAVNKVDRKPTGNRGQTSAPSDLYQTKDGWILVSVVGEPLFKRWAELMGEEHWLTDPRFADDKSRGDNGEQVSERMQAWCSERTREEALEALAEARIPAGSVNTLQETLDDPHINQMGWMHPMDYPGLPTPAPVMQVPLRMSGTDLSIKTRSPEIGEHTDQILHELGYSDAEIAEFRAERVV
ncbi:MAG: CoA transferase, partial [Pseudomonadota bacterium]